MKKILFLFCFIKIILPLFLICLISSCKKEKGPAKGKVINKWTSEGVPNAKVFLMGERGDCWSCPSVNVGSTTTNSEGEFLIDFDYDKNLIYGLTARHPEYFPEYNPISFEHKGVDIPLEPIEYLNIHFKKNPPLDSIYDQLEFSSSSNEHFYLGLNSPYASGRYDTIIKSIVRRNETVYMHWQYQTHFINFGEFRDSIKCINEESYYSINW